MLKVVLIALLVAPAAFAKAPDVRDDDAEQVRLRGEWENVRTGQRIEFRPDGKYGPCNYEGGNWYVSNGKLNIDGCIDSSQYDYSFSASGLLTLGPGDLKGRYRRVGDVRACRR